MFKGYLTALVTPWKNSKLDLNAFNSYLNRLIANKIAGLIVCGTTGEATFLSSEERSMLVKAAIFNAKDKVPVIVGVGSPDTRTCLAQASEAEQQKADAIMVSCPYYVKPSQEGIYQHFRTIHDSTKLPILIYNVPSRTGVDIETDTVKRIVDNLPRVKGLKEATNNLCRIAELAKTYPLERFQILCGNDDIALAAFAMGACGVISVTANVVPNKCLEMYEQFFKGNHNSYCSIRNSLVHLQRALFIESNPMPVKYALHLMGEMSDEVRSPLTQLSDKSKAEVKAAMHEAGIQCKDE